MPITLGLRPRLKFNVPGDSETMSQKIREAYSEYNVTVTDSYLVINIPKERQHYWSPHLQVELEDNDGEVLVSGLITPMPAVWTMFAGMYSLILVLGFFGTIYGLAQKQLGQAATGLWSIPISILLLACVYAAAMIGQRIGRKQTEELVQFLHACADQ